MERRRQRAFPDSATGFNRNRPLSISFSHSFSIILLQRAAERETKKRA
jgi:hypothetical protein